MGFLSCVGAVSMRIRRWMADLLQSLGLSIWSSFARGVDAGGRAEQELFWGVLSWLPRSTDRVEKAIKKVYETPCGRGV